MVHFGIKSVAEVCRATECRTRKIQVDVLPVVDLCKKSAKWHFLVGGATQVTRYRLESSFFLHHFYVYDHEKVTNHGSVRRSSLVSQEKAKVRDCAKKAERWLFQKLDQQANVPPSKNPVSCLIEKN